MTFTDEELQGIYRETTKTPSTAKTNSAFSDQDLLRIHTESRIASGLSSNPDRSARVQSVESEFGVPRDIADKHLDTLESKRRPDVSGIFEDAPVTARHLSNPDYAALVGDELDTQRALERSARGYWENVGRSLAERGTKFVGSSLKASGALLFPDHTDLNDALEKRGLPKETRVIGDWLETTGKDITKSAKNWDYVPDYTMDKLLENPGIANYFGFVYETAIPSLVDMVASRISPAGYAAVFNEQMADERAINKGMESAGTQERLEALPSAIVSGALERIGAGAVFDIASVQTFKQAAQAALEAGLKEGLTEFPQEVIQYFTERIGTLEDVDFAEAFKSGVAGFISGSTFGASVRGATANAQAAYNQYTRSMNEQEIIDRFNDVADGKLRDRSIGKLKAYAEDVAASYGIESVRIDGQVFNQEAHKELIGLVKFKPAEDGDVQIPMSEYVALPKETRAALRPYVRIQPDSLSQIEAQSWEQVQEESLLRVVKQAKVKSANYKRAEELYKTIAGQIAATGVYSKSSSVLMGKFYATYLSVKAENEKMSVDDVFSQLELEVRRDDGRGAGLLNQPAYHGSPHRFDDKFSLEKIGTGEGAQAYGYGLYFSGSKEIAEHYRRTLSSRSGRYAVTVNGDDITKSDRVGGLIGHAAAAASAKSPNQLADKEGVLRELELQLDSASKVGLKKMMKQYSEAIKRVSDASDLKVEHREDRGQLYEVEIPDDGSYLRWDKPLREQSETVKKAITALEESSNAFTTRPAPDGNRVEILSPSGDGMGYYDPSEVEESLKNLNEGYIKNSGGRELTGGQLYERLSKLSHLFSKLVDDQLGGPLMDQATGADFVRAMGRGKLVSDYLKSVGVSGIKYLDGDSRSKGEGNYNYVIFDDADVQIVKTFYQDDSRASIEILPNKAIIRLKESSNLSSFFHEAGHYFLEMERKFASSPNATDRQKKDFQHMLDFIGAPDGNIQTEHHEKFARAFEMYIAEGRAPSVELKAAFRRFAQWIINVYKTLRNLDVELTPEIRGVFDRMLATDEQIERAHQKFWYELMPEDRKETQEDEGKVDPAISGRIVDAKDRAKERLRSRLIKELKFRQEKEWKEERKTVIDDLKSRIAEEPRYKAIEWLRENPVSREDALAAIGATSPKLPKVLQWVKENDLTAEDIRSLKSKGSPDLKRQKLIQWMKDNDVSPEELVRALDPEVQKQRRKLNGLTSKEGLPLDDAAELTGYPSGKTMVLDIVKSPSLAEEAGARADAEMLKRHGDILNDGSIEKMADEIMHSEEQAKTLLAQLKAVNPSSRLDSEAIKQEAREAIGRLPAKKIKPDGYYRSEVKHAREYEKSLAEGDIPMAAFHAQQRLVQFHLAREATAVKARVDRQRNALKGWSSRSYAPSSVAANYAQNLRTYASLWDFRKNQKEEHDKALSRLESVSAWLLAQQHDANEFLKPQILDSITARFIEGQREGKPISIPSYETMTVDELQGVYDMASHFRFIGGQMSKEAQLRRKAQAEEIVKSVEENSGAEYEIKQIDGLVRDKVKAFGRRFFADHLYLRRKLEQMDGNKDGILKKLIWEPIVAASNKKYDLRMESAKELREILKPIDSTLLGRGKGKATVNKENGVAWTLGTRERIMLALYWGNDYSRQAIMDGHGVTESDVLAMLSNLTRPELDAVEKLWKFNDKHWPEFSAVNTRLFGSTPPKVEPSPYVVNGRKMTGGYMSITYRHGAKAAARGKDVFDDAAQKIANGSHSMAMSQSGAAMARVGSGGQMVSLELQNIATAAEEAITTIAFSEVSKSIGQIITNVSVVEAIQKKHSPEVYQSLRDNITSIVRGDTVPSSDLMKALRWFRMNLTYAILAYSFRNFIQQPTSFFNVIGKVGEVEAISALLDFYHHPFKYAEEIKAKSVFMRNRTAYINRETAEVTSEIGTGKVGFFKRYAFAHQTLGDSLIAFAAWKAGYKEGLAKYGDEAKAIAYADDIVASTIGSGMAKDMSPMLHGTGIVGSGNGPNEIAKQFTFMGSFFSFTFNLLAETAQKNDLKTIKGSAQFARQSFWYLVPPAIVGKLLVSSIPGEDDDEAWWQWALGAVGEYGLGMVFFLRDIVSIYKGFDPSIPYQSSVKQLGGLFEEVFELFEEDDEFEFSDGKKIVQGLQPFVPLPGSGQILRTADYANSYAEGEEGDLSPYDALVEGKERQK